MIQICGTAHYMWDTAGHPERRRRLTRRIRLVVPATTLVTTMTTVDQAPEVEAVAAAAVTR